MKKERNSEIEKLRIIAMLFIIIQHCVAHNSVDYTVVYKTNFLSGLIMQWGMLGRVGVSIFILIFGYFGVEQAFNTKRLLNLFVEVLTYSVLTYTVLCLTGLETISIKGLLKAFLPISTLKYWFISAYLIFSLLTPYVNKMLKQLSKKEFKTLIMVEILLWSILLTLSFNQAGYFCYEMEQFLLYYCVGAYIRLFPIDINSIKKKVYLALGGVLQYILCPQC